MTATAARYLYITRHGQASEDESTLTEAGRRQAALLGERLSGTPITAIHHGPLPRAEETARLIGAHLAGAPLVRSETGRRLPAVPAAPGGAARSRPTRRSPGWRASRRRARAGTGAGAGGARRFTGTVEGDEPRHELLVTHNFLAAWLVRAALEPHPTAGWASTTPTPV